MRVNNVSFRHEKQAAYFFRDLSFSLAPGMIHALHGKNGVGKSVLLNILNKSVDANCVMTGEVIAEKTVLMHQQFDQSLVFPFTFMDNMQFSGLTRYPGLFSRLRQPPLFPAIIDRFNIDVNIPVQRLSGGQRQVLALLMKLQRDTKVLLLDEPTAALDEQNAAMVFDFLSELRDVTILVVCHDQDLIRRYATGSHLLLQVDADGRRLKLT